MEDKIILPRLKLKKQKENCILEKIKEHKKEIIIAGVTVVTVVTVVGAIIILTNWDVIKIQSVANLNQTNIKVKDEIFTSVSKTIKNDTIKIPSKVRVIDVSKHIRNLPEGWKASPQKVDLAMKIGIVLEPHQTLVDDYTKLCA